MKESVTDEQIMRALIKQVMRAASGDVEWNVTTRISVPMWKAFLRGCGDTNLKALPKPGFSVFGSRTILVKSKRLFAVSYRHTAEKFRFEVVR